MSRNKMEGLLKRSFYVTSREGRVSRNGVAFTFFYPAFVTSREGRVSRNADFVEKTGIGHMSRPARDV